MAQRSIPALPRTCNRKMPSKAALLKRTRAQRIPFRPGVCYSNKGRIHSRRPILSSSFPACKTAADHTFRFDGDPRATSRRAQTLLQCRWASVPQGVRHTCGTSLFRPLLRNTRPNTVYKDAARNDNGRSPLGILNACCDELPIFLYPTRDDEIIFLGRLNGACS